MALETHTSFETPLPEEVLWRYMNLSKFLHLLTTRTLWLTNAEVLAENDPYEGLLTNRNYRHRHWDRYETLEPEDKLHIDNHNYGAGLSDDQKMAAEAAIRDLRISQAFAYRRSYFISCWAKSEVESAALWKIYAGDDGTGIAITSTTARISSALHKCADDIYLGQVNYLNYQAQEIGLDNGFNSIMSKRESFSHEREVRLVYWDTSITSYYIPAGELARREGFINPSWIDPAQPINVGKTEQEIESSELIPGRAVAVDLDKLIDGVWTAPGTAPWVTDTVLQVCRAFGVERAFRPSTILERPAR